MGIAIRRPHLDDALALARESDIGFHLLDRIYGTLITAAPDPVSALAALDEAEVGVRGPLETCPGCRITLTVPAAIAAARVGDLDRLVSDGRTGRLVKPGDPAALADALRALAERPDERARLGAAARRTALAAHTWDGAIGRILSACGLGAEAA